jgi:signal peptidase I
MNSKENTDEIVDTNKDEITEKNTESADLDTSNKEDTENKKDSKDKKKTSTKLEIYDWVQCVVVALVGGILIFTFVGRMIMVDGNSMFATLHNNDMVLTSNLFYSPKAGDIVILQTNSYGDSPLVKRIIATEGQTVNIDFDLGIVYVDGEALYEPYTNTLTNLKEDFTGEVTVPEGCMFVMGDNRNASLDSRNESVGMVDVRCIIGKVYFIIIPGNNTDPEMGKLGRDWSRIGSVYKIHG